MLNTFYVVGSREWSDNYDINPRTIRDTLKEGMKQQEDMASTATTDIEFALFMVMAGTVTQCENTIKGAIQT